MPWGESIDRPCGTKDGRGITPRIMPFVRADSDNRILPASGNLFEVKSEATPTRYAILHRPTDYFCITQKRGTDFRKIHTCTYRSN